ncbi:MAG: BMP family protein [Arenibacterium sp.]
MTQRKALKNAIESKANPPAAESDPFLIYDLGGKFDRSFNEAAFEGAERWAAKTGDTYGDFEITSDAQRARVLDQVAESSSPVVTVGFGFINALDQQAPLNPGTEFVIIDAIVDQPNVTSYTFAEHEGAYLMGMFAAMATDTDVIGFVGGQDIPLVRRYSTAFEAGAEAIDPDIDVLVNMTGTTPVAWNDPVRGGELADAQITLGADVIYAVAGGTGLGVLQAVADAGILGIGTDSNQNDLHPGNILTSMVKRVDVVVEDAFDFGNNLPGGRVEVGLAEGAISYALDDNNRGLVDREMIRRVDQAIEDIISGDIVVPDYLDTVIR